MMGLFPAIKPFVIHTLAVDAPHVLHVEECGNPDGLPVVFIHGGPGGGCEAYHRRFFDPDIYRAVLFDQRGCGRSVPHAEVAANDTLALVADMERIREHLGIERWLLFGGSWGSTLALAYAEAHPERVLGMVLRGIFLCRPHEIRWFYQEGASRLFPDYWVEFLRPIPETERGDLLQAYHRRLFGDDEVARMAAAKAWSRWEARTSTLLPRKEIVDHFSNPYTALALARIECHYFANDSFLEPNQLLRDAHRIASIPGFIVHGRYDVVCPVENAWELHEAWPGSQLRIVPDAGHSAAEPGITDALLRALAAMAERIA
ncbi:MAG: prolyl aminopeptidase [Gammaproteobacteria bacterium]|jgi:proline iminopeptidase|nr:prolyl aminopeptidase [Gammaproteobacteria bacterium]